MKHEYLGCGSVQCKLELPKTDGSPTPCDCLDGLDDAKRERLEKFLKRKEAEVALLCSIMDECIRKPLGIEPHRWSDYKHERG